MDTATLVAGKGKQVEIVRGSYTATGTLMGKQSNKQVISFYVRVDGRKLLIAARWITRFV